MCPKSVSEVVRHSRAHVLVASNKKDDRGLIVITNESSITNIDTVPFVTPVPTLAL